MLRNFKLNIGIILFWALAVFVRAQAVDPSAPVPDYYGSALQAYVSGDFDQAILLDSKALQANSQDKKAQALLNILVTEKDNANKTVIWIGGKPAIVEAPNNGEQPAPVTIFKEKVVGENPVRLVPVNNHRLAELETRVQTVAFLMERDSFSQYRELNGAQVATNKRLEDLGGGIQRINILFLLALFLSAAALWISWKNGQDLKRQKESLHQASGSENRERVVNIRRL